MRNETRLFDGSRKEGAILLDNLEIPNMDKIYSESGEGAALLAEFKIAVNDYLEELETSPVRSLADLIAFNKKNSDLEMIEEYGEDNFLAAEATNGMGKVEKEAVKNMSRLSKDGLEKMMREKKVDALVCGGSSVSGVLAIGGFPGISVPAGYDKQGFPVGIVFGGLKGSEPTLIQIAYGFEQATKLRKPPTRIHSL